MRSGSYPRHWRQGQYIGSSVVYTLQVGAQFRDGFDGQIYTVKQELTHGPVHSMKRYMVEKKGESNPK